ncbi:MAG TPA: PAS domain-containing protein [Bryobacteraceae bacterium]|jgi:PAS domain S-box-containing protein|nr:PAS domain-containing protein [Bryobacteraceae bacterium]
MTTVQHGIAIHTPQQAFSPQALETFPYGLLLIGADRRISLLNTAAKAIFMRRNVDPGETVESLQAALNLFEPSMRTRLANEQWPLSRALAGHTVEPTEYGARTVVRKNSFWMECSAQPLRQENGEIEGAIFTIRDTTDRKKRELALEAADQLRDFIYHGNVAGILHTTIDGRVVDCNDAFVRMIGYESKEELKNLRAPQFYFEPSERDRLLREIRTSHQLSDYEVCLRRRDNTRCWGLSNVRLLEPQRGEVGGSLISTIVDITDRKQWEDTLRQSEQRFAAFMRHLPGMAYIKDPDGKYVYYNDACWMLFGKHPTEIIGSTDDQIWRAEEATLYRANDLRVMEERKPIEVTEPVRHPDGIHSWLIYKFPIIENGDVVLVGGIGIDITERQALEDQLTQSRKMEALGRLAGGVAHDFNNVLTVISGYGQLALEGIEDTPVERLTVYIQEILNSARRAAGLTTQLLAFSRRQLIQPKVLDLGDLLRNLGQLLRRMIGEHVDLTLHLASQKCLVRADAHQIEQVMMNLAANARDAMPLGGNLDIDCHLLAEPRERPGMSPLGVVIEVRDNGIGMDEATRGQLFEPFFSSKEKGKGTGLGLSTAYGVVTQAEGEIEVESAQGEGTTFRIYFPVATGEVEELPPPLPDPEPARLETILLVEDEASVRTLAETILRRQGYRVVSADCGDAAIKIWQEKQGEIDILLTDVIMPRMSGGELAHKLRAMKPDLKVLFMSGYTDDMIASHGLMAGETQLIQKPFTSAELGRKLRAVLDA